MYQYNARISQTAFAETGLADNRLHVRYGDDFNGTGFCMSELGIVDSRLQLVHGLVVER